MLEGGTAAASSRQWLYGEAGDDVLTVGAPVDLSAAIAAGETQAGSGNGFASLSGGRGDDRLLGGGGDDVLYGGAGDDTLVGGEARTSSWPTATVKRWWWAMPPTRMARARTTRPRASRGC